LICTLEQRLRLLAAAGIRNIIVLPFTTEVARLSPRQFVSQILCDALETKAVFVGENFRFGRRQRGTSQTLKLLGAEFAFLAQTVHPVCLRGEIISSSAIRRYLSSGNVSRAGRLLGRCFSIEGPVVRGHGVGSKQTVPTVNLRPPTGQLVPRGVYITETREPSPGRRWESITNCGFRPTFGGNELTIETFLLSPLEGDAPERIEVRFHRFVRDERQFPNPEALRGQILKDVSRAQAYWRRLSNPQRQPASIY
jgi:riboflavin kinase/FMN adenylyltransferase